MRLDHLLSKEHWPARRGALRWLVQGHAPAVIVIHLRMAAGVGGGARGWNADQFGRVDVLARQYGLLIQRFAWGWVWNAGVCGVGGWLAHCWVLKQQRLLYSCLGVGGVVLFLVSLT